jgi:Pvc16 N-terminal domain
VLVPGGGPVFDDLDAALQRLLGDAAAPAAVREADVSFETPGRDYAPTGPTVNLFLHEISENRARRDPEPVVDRSGPELVLRVPPLRVECAYLITTWADSTVGAAVRVGQEHRLLGLTLAWLSRFATLPAASLGGALAGQPFPPPAVVARPATPTEPGQFWTALGMAPRPSLVLRVTVALDLGLATALGPPVTGSQVRVAPIERRPQDSRSR